MPSTKTLEILYFASHAEQAGKDAETIRFDGDTLTELYQYLHNQYGFNLATNKLAVAINHEITHWQSTIHDGDTVAFVPPVAGG